MRASATLLALAVDVREAPGTRVRLELERQDVEGEERELTLDGERDELIELGP